MNSSNKKTKVSVGLLSGYASILFLAFHVAQAAENFVGNWGLRIPATVYIRTEKEMKTPNIKEETSYLVTGQGANGVGNMEIREDGTYTLRVNDLGNHWSTSGKWRENPGYRIGGETVNGIALIDAHGKESQFGKNWFVYYKEDGRMQTAAPPYGIGYIYDLVGANGKVNSIQPKKAQESTVEPVGERASSGSTIIPPSQSDAVEKLNPEANKPSDIPVTSDALRRTWNIEELKSQFINQSEEHLRTSMGEPNSTGYKSLEYRNLKVVDNSRQLVCSTVHFGLTESKGGTVWQLTCL